jgi:phosphopantetheinyl transferase
LHTWVGKESLLKGLGVGIADHMANIELAYSCGDQRKIVDVGQRLADLAASDPQYRAAAKACGSHWSITWNELQSQHLLAVAQPRPNDRFAILHW